MAGRPKKWDNVEDLQKSIYEYFENENGKITITGLALHLGFESRQSIYDYEKDGEYSYTIKKAKLRVENFYEKELLGDHTSGAIFALKNFGWADKTENKHEVKVSGIKPIEWVKTKDVED